MKRKTWFEFFGFFAGLSPADLFPKRRALPGLCGFALVFLMVSCAQNSRMILENEKVSSLPERPPAVLPPERPVIPPIPEDLLGRGLAAEESLSGFLLAHNPETKDFSPELAKLYVEEAAAEGINHDLAFAQMCLETGFLKFGGLVTPEMNNFCGLGAIGPDRRGETFPDARTGVRAHIQHLKAYATDEFPNRELVDPRYFMVRSGSSPKLSGLAGTWAADRFYGEKLGGILERLYEFTFSGKYGMVRKEEQK